MRLLLDECIPRKLKDSFVGYECLTVPEAGFAGKKNGELLALAEEAGFYVLITLDRGIEYQQNLASRTLAIIVVRSKSSRLRDLLPHVPQILNLLKRPQPGQLVRTSD